MDVREMARLGGLARTGSMTPEEQRKLATKASKAAAKVRTEKAQQKKAAAAARTKKATLRKAAER